MIPLEVTLLIFFVIGLVRKSKTFFILSVFAWLNIYIYPKTSADDLYLMLTYTTVDFCAALAVLYYGDIQKLYQTTILSLMILTHCVMELALVVDVVWFIESSIYINTITALLILQMLGGIYGIHRLSNPLRSRDFDTWQISDFGLPNHKTSNFTNEDTK